MLWPLMKRLAPAGRRRLQSWEKNYRVGEERIMRVRWLVNIFINETYVLSIKELSDDLEAVARSWC